MSAALGTPPAVGRQVFYRLPEYPSEQKWLPAETLRARPNGSIDIKITVTADGLERKPPLVVRRVRNGIKPGQWCGWADDLWLPREGGELMRGIR
jgi:hypothetical protein